MPGKIRLRELLLVAGVFLVSTPAAAWNAAGHRLSAAIAWRQMDAPTRETAGTLLAQHPDYLGWLQRNSSLPPAYAAFLEASTWPDEIKRDKRFHDTDETPTPLLEGFSDMARHRNWHYIDHPVDQTPTAGHSNGELNTRLAILTQSVGSANTNAADRAIALAWLIHLIADAHQPLHAASRYDSEGRSDEGGNALWIDNPYHPRRNSMTLHAYWDDLPGPPWLRGEHLETAAGALMAQSGKLQNADPPQKWLDESLSFARSAAYEGLEGEVPTLTAGYHERATKIARERVALAGKRLGLLLEKLLGPASVSRGTATGKE